MEQVRNFRPYFYLTLLIALTSFEYFFRNPLLPLLLYSLAIIDVVFNYPKDKRINFPFVVFFAAITLINMIHAVDGRNSGLTPMFTLPLSILGLYMIARILRGSFIKTFVTIIFIISLYSTVIYLLCLNKSVFDFFYNTLSSHSSLYVERAVFDQGGKNFIIYNFVSVMPLQSINFWRNCGPFWEPGMFAVYIILALFFNIFVEKQSIRWCNLVLIIALITTFSTGGFMAGLLLIVFYILKIRLKSFVNVLLIPLLVVGIYSVLQLDYIGEKTQMQYDTAEVGSDKSRFGAFATQQKMIEASPYIGGEPLEKYTRTKTVASGTLLPFVNYGIPFGILYFILLYNSCRYFARSYNKKYFTGLSLFLLILTLSFSQTILLKPSIMVLLFYGLQCKLNLKQQTITG